MIKHIRAQDAKAKSAFYAGLTDRHPHGQSGLGYITAPEDDRRCLDTSSNPAAFECGEYNHLIGSDFQAPRWHLWKFKTRRKA